MPLNPRRPPGNRFSVLPAAACVYAAAELLLVLTVSGFSEWGRAEALLFLTWRPWLLVAAAALVSGQGRRWRLAFYALALLLAGLAESLFLIRVGASDPWPEMLRGFAASSILLVFIDILIQIGQRWRRRVGVTVVASACLLLLFLLAVRAPWDGIVAGPGDSPPARVRPRLLLMTSLPIVWGEFGAFDPRSRPSQSLAALKEEFDVMPIDALGDSDLAGARLLLLAQPRWLTPSELAAFDSWVRRGGRAVILADPRLDWSSDLPLGDTRRPVRSSLLGPLLAHWGVTLEPDRPPGRVTIWPTGRRRIETDSPGRFSGTGESCGARGAYVADCRIGAGRAILFGDADLLRDDLWVRAGRNGSARHRRLADNPLYVADLLDEVAGLERRRVRAPVTWARSRISYAAEVSRVLPPLFLVLAGALLLAWWGRNRPRTYPQDHKG